MRQQTHFQIGLRRVRRRLTHWRRTVTGRPSFRAGMVILLLATISSLSLHLVEKTPPPDFDGGEWPYATYLGTVREVIILLLSGFDAEKPNCLLGFAFAFFCLFLGIALLALITADLASILVSAAMAGLGRRQVPSRNHIIICGWHYTTRVLLQQLVGRERRSQREIAVIDDELESLPVADPDIHFVSGDPSDDEVLEKAGIRVADTCIVPIDWKLPESIRDSRTTLTAMAVKSLNPNVYTCVEILASKNQRHIERAQVEEMVCLGSLTERILCQCAVNHGLSRIFEKLLTFAESSEIYRIRMPDKFAGRSFRWLLRKLNSEHDAILLSVCRNGSLHTNPQDELFLERGDELFVLSEEDPEAPDFFTNGHQHRPDPLRQLHQTGL